MKQRLSVFSLFILSLAAIPTLFESFNRSTLVQSVNDSPNAPIVYDNSLSPNWENWSWNSDLQFESNESPYQGAHTINWRSYNWGGLYLHVKNNESVDSSLYENLEFSLKGTQDNQRITFVLYDENNQPMGGARPLEELGGHIPNGSWKKYTIPMKNINPEMRKIKGIVFQSTKGEDQRLFIDEVQFVLKPTTTNQDSFSVDSFHIYADTLNPNWDNWSWDSSSVLNETFKTNSGSNSIAYTAQRPWAALYLHAKQPVDTSLYNSLTFSIYASQPNQAFSIAVLDSYNNLLKNPQPLENFGGGLEQNNWKTFTIPLSELGANSKYISGVILQESKGQAQPIIYIDSISLKGQTSISPTLTLTPTVTTIAPTATPTPTITPQKSAMNSTSGNPFTSNRLYVNPDNNAKRTEDAWRSQGRTADADALSKISNTATAKWITGGDPYNAVNEYVTRAYSANELPVIVSYNIPGRDCGQYSHGGTSYEGYKSWINSVAHAIGDRKAVVILEPDALGLDCLQNDTTYSLMKYAVETLESKPQTSVYIESATWVNPDIMANRLSKVGIQNAQGFAINTSGYNTTNTMIDFGNNISAKVGKKFVIDTSRNGRGPYDQSQPEPWCNPPDRALGPKPTAQTGHSNVDAFLWVKVPGESDGTCRGGPSAGSWWEEYALGLSQRAAY